MPGGGLGGFGRSAISGRFVTGWMDDRILVMTVNIDLRQIDNIECDIHSILSY